MNIQVCITTFERSESLRRLLVDLEREGAKRVRVYDDCSPRDDYAQAVEQITCNGWTWHRATTNHGKDGHPRLMEQVWRDLKGEPPADLYVFIEDDNRLCTRFFERLVETWQSIGAPPKGTLRLLTDSRDKEGPKPIGKADGKADRTGWVDTMYATALGTLRDFNFEFPVRSCSSSATSSGTGAGLTRALAKRRHKVYRANPSLIAHVSIPSRMHGTVREKNPLHAKNFVDGDERHAQLLHGEI